MIIKLIQKFFKNKTNIIITAAIFIFLFAFSLRLWNLNLAGRVTDENVVAQHGILYIKMLLKGDFTNELWWKYQDHPVLVRYFRGIFSFFDISYYLPNGTPILKYDLTYNRLVSAFLTSLTCVLVMLIGARYINLFTGITSGIILAMLPILLGHSQIGMYEPFVIFFYTLTVWSFILFLEYPTYKRVFLTGIFLGLAVQSKESNILLFPQLLLIYAIWFRFRARRLKRKQIIKKIFIIFFISVITFIIIWPTTFLKFRELLEFQLSLRTGIHTSIPEVFYGKLFLTRRFYYLVYFLITTPLIIYLLFLAGLVNIDKLNDKPLPFLRFNLLNKFPKPIIKLNRNYKWIFYTLIIWFIFPFIMSFYHKREQGVRYIIEIYAPMSIVAAMGFDYIVSFFTKIVWKKYFFLIPLIIYQLIILLRITPYYLDYFNILVGGAKNVYENKLFHLAWWGEGNREAGLFLSKNAPPRSKIGNALSFKHTLPPLPMFYVEQYQPGEKYDYVLLDYYNIVRLRFDDRKIRENYKVVYSVMADGAHLVEIYKHK